MSDTYSIDQLPVDETTLGAKEYLQFLQLFEGATMPVGVRAYLVSKSHEEERQITPVKEGYSIVRLETDLIDHLNGGLYDTAYFQRLHAYCEERLARCGIKAVSQGQISRCGSLFNEIALLADDQDRACYFDGLDGDAEELALRIKALRAALCRIGWMADIGANALGGDEVRSDAEEWMLPPSYRAIGEAAKG